MVYVYLGWHRSVFGKRLEKAFSDQNKAVAWLREVALKEKGVLHEDSMLVRREAERPLNQIGIDDGYTWWVETKEVT